MLGVPCRCKHDISEQDHKVQSRCTLGITETTDLAFGGRRSLHGLLGDIHPAAQRRHHAPHYKAHQNSLQLLAF